MKYECDTHFFISLELNDFSRKWELVFKKVRINFQESEMIEWLNGVVAAFNYASRRHLKVFNLWLFLLFFFLLINCILLHSFIFGEILIESDNAYLYEEKWVLQRNTPFLMRIKSEIWTRFLKIRKIIVRLFFDL